MQEKTRQTIRAALFEAIFVVLGVVLALAANEWRQAVADRRQAESALESIVEEIESNRVAVAGSLEYHEERLELLRQVREGGEPLHAGRFPRGFVMAAPTYQTAWASAAETGALRHMPYEAVLRVSRVYARQARYEEQTRRTGEILYEELYRGGQQAVLQNPAGLATLIGTFVFRERELLERYDEILATLRTTR